MKYTFEWRWSWCEGDKGWTRRTSLLNTPEEAAEKAAEWMAICFDNEAIIETRLTSVVLEPEPMNVPFQTRTGIF